MSDEEEESMSEGFSASEEEWKPSKDVRGGESSDDDDSDFEESRTPAATSTNSNSTAAKKRESKNKHATKQAAIKKRKPAGQSLRAKLYNKYRPPPKTFPSPSSAGSNSPSASTSRTASKNAKAPNESGDHDNDSSSDSSIADYLVNPLELDMQSSFFKVHGEPPPQTNQAPTFDCNAGINTLSDSGSEDNNESSADERGKSKAYDFGNLLENVNSLERAKETIAKRTADTKATQQTNSAAETTAMDVNSLLALGERQSPTAKTGATNIESAVAERDLGPQKLSKTKSTRVKRHTKTRPTSTVVGDTDDSDWEEVADDAHTAHASHTTSNTSANLEIHVELPSRHRPKEKRSQQDLELVFRRKLNRELKERQLQLHKASLLCHFGRAYICNRLLNDTLLMQTALKLLPSRNAYPPERGTEIKYYQSLMTWFKTALKLDSPNLYLDKAKCKKQRLKKSLLAQLKSKEARCKQDMVFIFVTLLRGMGLQCRLVFNLQPLPLRPHQSDLLSIKLKRDGDKKDEEVDTNKKKAKPESDEKPTVQIKEGITSASVGELKQDEGGGKARDKHTSKISKEKSSKEDKPKVEKNKKKNENVNEKDEEVVAKKAKLVEEANRHPKSNKDSNKPDNKEKNSKESKQPTDKQTNRKADKSGSTAKGKKVSQPEADKAPSISAETIPVKSKPTLSKLRAKQQSTVHATDEKDADDERPSISVGSTPIALRTRHAQSEKTTKAAIVAASSEKAPPLLPEVVISAVKTGAASTMKKVNDNENKPAIRARVTRSRSKSPKMQISAAFLQTDSHIARFGSLAATESTKPKRAASKSPVNNTVKISAEFLTQPSRILRSRQQSNEASKAGRTTEASIPQLDGADDLPAPPATKSKSKRPQLKKLSKTSSRSQEESDEDFEPSPPKQPKKAPKAAGQKSKTDRRVLSSDDEDNGYGEKSKRKPTAADIWVEAWCDVEEQWVCIDLFKAKIHSVDSIRKSASSNFAYVFAFQNDLSFKDVTARYCPNWTTTVRKSRVERAWLETAVSRYYGRRTARDIKEDQELRRIHEEKPLPTTISEYKDHPLYALERHLLKFQAIYPPDPPTLGFIRGEPVYSRDCVHTLHSREIWLKQARTVKLGEQPYKIVKARPKWDRLTQSVIKDQPLEIFGYWQTQDYEPPTAENGLVPRNAYGNVELFKACMLPKKTVHLKLPGLNRICKKLGIDCANAMIGFDFHQGVCHPLFDGFVVCEEFADQVTAAWYQDQEEQDRKEQEKYEARVYGNWKKLIRGLLIRERLKKKYNF